MFKLCQKCVVEKELKDFYKHSEMKDGYLNFCKKCVKKRVSAHSKTDSAIKADRERGQKPERKEWRRKFSIKNRERYRLRKRCIDKFWKERLKGNIEKKPCDVCGTEEKVEAHHPDYNKPFEVMWKCSKHHKEWHRKYKAILPVTT